jgi:hypothetical protein
LRKISALDPRILEEETEKPCCRYPCPNCRQLLLRPTQYDEDSYAAEVDILFKGCQIF